MAPAETQPAPQAAPLPELQVPQEQLMGLSSLLEQIVDETTKRTVIDQELERRTFNENWRLAKVFAAAGYFTDATDQYKAMAKIEIGRSWGLTPAEAMRHVYIVNGKPALENEMVASKLRQAGWSWEVQFHGNGPECKGCTLFPKFKDEPVLVVRRKPDGSPVLGSDGAPITDWASVSFTEAEAIAAGLNGKNTWKAWRPNMFYWKAIAQLKRFFAPDVMSGALMVIEAEDITPVPQRPEPARAAISIEQLTPSKDSNRGHDAVAPPPAAPAEKIKTRLVNELMGASAKAGLSPEEFKAILNHHQYNNVADVTTTDYSAVLKSVLEAGQKK